MMRSPPDKWAITEIEGLFDTMPGGRESRNVLNGLPEWTAIDRRDNESIKYTRIFLHERVIKNALGREIRYSIDRTKKHEIQ
jgi:hypothetical protein